MAPNEMNEFNRSLGRLEGKVDLIIDRITGVYHTLETHDARLDKLENSFAYSRGAIALIAAGVSIAVPVLIRYLKL